MVRPLTAVLATALLLAAAGAAAQTPAKFRPEAERRNRRATELYQAGRFAEALQLYQAAYDLYPDPKFLFNVALAREKTFDYEGCVTALTRFLDESKEAEAAVREQAELRLAACAQRTTIPVRFTSAPTNAAVYLGDGDARALKGRTPQELALAPGTYAVSMELTGYVPRKDTLVVAPGQRPQVDFVLDKLSSLRIEADPAGARVKVDDRPWESAPVTLELVPGTHQVEVVKDGYQPSTRAVRVEPGQEVSLVLPLRPLPRIRSLAIRTRGRVDGARVRIDGKDRGGLPLATSMSPGSHRLEVSAAGRIPFASDISVPEDRDLDLLLHLEGRRSRANRLVFYGLLGSAGVAAATGALFGLLALDDEAAFAKDPTPALGARGERRAEISDVSIGLAVGLAGGAVLWHFLTRPGASTARVVY